MLHEFLLANHDELEQRCRAKSAARVQSAGSAESSYGIPFFITQLVEALRAEREPGSDFERWWADGGASSAARHGNELLDRGFTVGQVVHDYGNLCQALTELAGEKHQTITVDEFRTFNRCLDNATADAVAAFSRERDRRATELTRGVTNERLGSLAHELRNQLATACLAFTAIKEGSVAIGGATGRMLERSLVNLQDLIERSIADVRMTAGIELRREAIAIDVLVSELRVPVVAEAFNRELVFSSSVEKGLFVDADRHMLGSAISNLLQNALKFTRPHGQFSLAARASKDRVIIEVKDECGGLPAGKTEELFVAFGQYGSNRSGLGLGLAISRRNVEANGGTLLARDIPGTGCIFTIDLPKKAAVHS
jgi:signal transduction histidine kinase